MKRAIKQSRDCGNAWKTERGSNSVKGILADVNAIGDVEYLVQRMQSEPWREFWLHLGLVLWHFEDFGLSSESPDSEIWQTCQTERLILVTDNRNNDSADSLEATIRRCIRPDSLLVFTISNKDRFSASSEFADKVVAKFYTYLIDLDAVLGTGRLYLP